MTSSITSPSLLSITRTRSISSIRSRSKKSLRRRASLPRRSRRRKRAKLKSLTPLRRKRLTSEAKPKMLASSNLSMSPNLSQIKPKVRRRRKRKRRTSLRTRTCSRPLTLLPNRTQRPLSINQLSRLTRQLLTPLTIKRTRLSSFESPKTLAYQEPDKLWSSTFDIKLAWKIFRLSYQS